MAKHREFDKEVTVYVWRFGGPARPGHAAVKLTGGPGGRDYISWWPDSGATKSGRSEHKRIDPNRTYKQDMAGEISASTQQMLELGPRQGGFAPREGQRNVLTGYNARGVAEFEWGQAAHEKIKIPAKGEGGQPYGLDIVRMHEWWDVFKRAPNAIYKFASKHKNCSGVAAAALRVGGGDQFAAPPRAIMYIDPNQIATWARQIRARVDQLNAAANGVVQQVIAAGERVELAATELMTLQEWTQLSNRDMRGSLVRSDRVKQIDAALRSYHSYHWDNVMSFHKLKVMGQVLDAVHYYLAHKPDSKRSEAVLTLGRQILAVGKAKADQYAGKFAENQHTLWAKGDLTE